MLAPSTSRPTIAFTRVTTPAAALSLVVIHFARLSQPVDAEALNTQVGTLAGVVTLEIGLDDSATIQYDPQRTTCERLVETVRALGFSVRSYDCGIQP